MEELEKFFEENKVVFISLLVLTVLPLLTIAGVWFYGVTEIAAILQNPTVSTILLLVVLGAITMAIGIIPTSIAGLACGFVFGFDSFALFIFTYAFAASLGYWGFKIFDKGHFVDNLRQLPQVETFWQKKDRFNWALVFFTRLTPVMPFAVTNIVLAACKFSFPIYILGSIAGILPRAAVFFWFGTEAQNLAEALDGKDGDYSRKIVTAVFLIIGLGALSLIGKKIWNEPQEDELSTKS